MSDQTKSRDQTSPGPATPAEPEINPKQLLKTALDLGPVLIFFITYFIGGIYWATGVLMAATVVAMIASRILLGHISVALLVTTAIVVGFGGLTLWFNDPRFIKMKPTIINVVFAVVLLGGVLAGKPLLRYLLGEVINLTDEGWRALAIRYAIFFLVMAGLNEVVWRNFSEATWVNFKFFGLPILTIAFFATQQGLLKQHTLEVAESSKSSEK